MMLIQIACLAASLMILSLCVVTSQVNRITIWLLWACSALFFMSFISARYTPIYLVSWLITTIFVIAAAAGAVAWEEYQRPREDGWLSRKNRQLIFWLIGFVVFTVILLMIEPKAFRTQAVRPAGTPPVAVHDSVSTAPTPNEESALDYWSDLRRQNP